MYNNEGDTKNMATLRESAKEYEPKTTLSIADLPEVSTELDNEEREFQNKTGKKFTIKVIVVDGVDYRVPEMVLKQLKEMIDAKPGMTKFRVKKTGEGLKTSYTVIPLD
jgi:hypothetical protein